MKKYIYIIIVLLAFSCDSENAIDCFQTAGNSIEQEFSVANFNRILVNRDVELIVRQGDEQRVVVQTGDNLLSDVTVDVIEGQLILSDNNSCNFVRDFSITKVFVTTPSLNEIRCSTQFEIKSDGVLAFNSLNLISEDFTVSDTFPIGDFRLNLDVDNLNIVSNNLSFFYLSGEVENLNINFASGDGRFEGENLIAQNISIFQRGSNDMLVNPQQSITGTIFSTGNVLSFNQPPIVEVEEVFKGRLIFID